MKRTRKILTAILALPALLVILGFLWIFLFMGERLCWWNPSIDTNYAPGYSEEAFDRVAQGMTKDQVINVLGEPFSKSDIPKGAYPYQKPTTSESWLYSGDGKCQWADWAWLGRWIDFDDEGKVTETRKVVHYD